jgi:hypothetical protein
VLIPRPIRVFPKLMRSLSNLTTKEGKEYTMSAVIKYAFKRLIAKMEGGKESGPLVWWRDFSSLNSYWDQVEEFHFQICGC